MEENFNNIQWNRIDAPDIDKNMLGVIQSLASYDFEARKEALTDLFDMIWHQGTLSWSASFAVPFLIERLQQEPEAELLEDILLDLVHLGTGSSFCDAAALNLDKDGQPSSENVVGYCGSSKQGCPSLSTVKPPHQNLSIYEDKRNTLEFQEQMQEELEGVRATYQAVYKGVNIYFDLLEHESPQVRIAAAYTLSCCKSEAARICTKMYARFSCEPDELVKATISLCLAFLSKSTPIQIAFFEQVLKSNESDIVKLSAAVTLAYIASEHMSFEALEILVNKIKKPYLLSKLCEHYDSPMLTAHHLLIIDFFSRLNDQQMARIIPVLTQQIEELPYGLDDLLELVFCEKTIPEGTTINELTDVQQFILAAIADDETTLTPNVHYMGGILEKLGSQGSVVREKLIGFLNGEKLEYDR